MNIQVGDHGCVFGDVRITGAGNFEAAAMPGEDGSFGAAKGVGVVESEFGAEKLCCPRENLKTIYQTGL